MIKHLKGLEINSIYDFDNAFSINELLCKFWEKIEETINISNESIDLLNWVKEQGLPKEVQKIINQLVADGTINQIINIDKIEELKSLIDNKIGNINLQIENIATEIPKINNKIGNINSQMETIETEIPKINSKIDNKIDDINSQMETIGTEIPKINTKVGRTEKGWADLNVFNEETRALILNLGEGDVNAVLGDLNVKSNNIGYEEITPDKLNFGRLGKNKFTGSFLYDTALTGDGSDGTFTVDKSSGGICAVVRVTEGTTYTISVESGHNRFRVGECADFPSHGVKVIKRHFADDDNQVTLRVREGMTYFIIYLSSSSQSLVPSQLQVEEGGRKTSYCKPTLILDYETNTIPQTAIKKDRYQIGYQLGIGFNIKISDKSISVSEDINIIVGEKRRYNLLKGNYSYSSIDAKCICVLANSDTKMLEFCKTSDLINKGSEYDYLGIINNESEQVFINGNYSINGNYIKPYTEDKLTNERNIITKEVNSNFTNSSSYITPNTTSGGNALNDLYSLWDNLVNNSDGYITKSLLGTDATGLPIYRYDFKPFAPQNNTMNISFPKVIFLGGIHGHERYCNFEDYRFFKELVENWTKNDVLEYLRFNVHFIVVPVQCPWGYQNKSRINSNGVNINRNHESDWVLTEVGNNYSGIAPMTEIETQLIDNLLSNNKDAVFAIDHHNFNSFAMDGHIAWFGSRSPKTHKTIFGLCNFMDGYTKKKFPWLLTDNIANKNKNLYCLKSCVGGGVASTMWLKYGIQGIIYETVPSWSFSTDKQKYSGTREDLQNLMTDLLGNLLLTVIKNNDYLISK